MVKSLRPFMGVDGEGCGRNRHGQQHYRLLAAGNASHIVSPLYTGKPLTELECFDWICDLPAEPILVGFSFGYDTSQILRGLPPERLDWLFKDKATEAVKAGMSRYTWFKDFGVEYLPKNYLRVCRTMRDREIGTVRAVPKSARTIYEVFGNFQMSFVRALEAFDIGREHWPMLVRNKDLRDSFVRITREIKRYNQIECILLAELMERFRELCHANDLRPKTWNGAGKVAAAEHTSHNTISAIQVALRVPEEVRAMAADAYYGGRFEVIRIGEIDCPVWEYDIRSAYPSAMRSLPCLLHGDWVQFTGNPPAKSLHVAYVVFDHPQDAPICGLPIRQKDGRLFWPRQGQGIYWSVELNAAKRLGTVLRYTAGWAYVCNCECRPFDWVEHRYEQRRALPEAQGYPIKLALNSLYGKLAQRVGNPRWSNLIWAGLITATTRAILNDAARQAPHEMLMFATDAVFTKAPLKLPIGAKLGQWEAKEHAKLFIMQPGVYWGAKRPKTRGFTLPASELAKHTETFEREWGLWCSLFSEGRKPPSVTLPLPLFVNLRLAHARGKPETACRWLDGTKHGPGDPNYTDPRELSFDWSRKRDALPVWETPTRVVTKPCTGAPDLVSVPHSSNTAWSQINDERLQFEDQPDAVDLSPVL